MRASTPLYLSAAAVFVAATVLAAATPPAGPTFALGAVLLGLGMVIEMVTREDGRR